MHMMLHTKISSATTIFSFTQSLIGIASPSPLSMLERRPLSRMRWLLRVFQIVKAVLMIKLSSLESSFI
jgi:hypothetical protein